MSNPEEPVLPKIHWPLPPFLRIPNFLEPQAHAALMDYALANEEKFEPTKLYNDLQDVRRRVSLGLVKFGPAKDALRMRMTGMIEQLITGLKIAPFQHGRIELELVAHGDGAFFTRHLDTVTGERSKSNSTRVISAVYYFHAAPKAFSGGVLRLFRFGVADKEGDYIDIEPEQNTLVVFPSWVTHEVLPVSVPSRQFGDARFAINIWVHRAQSAPDVQTA